MEIRRARPEDAEALARLTTELGYPADEAQMAGRLAAILGSPSREVFVAETGAGRLIGWIDVTDRPLLQEDAAAEIGGLVVAETHRGSGVGAALVARAEAWAIGRDLQTVRVRSRSTRAGAHEFYRRLGYDVLKTSLTFRKSL